MKTINNNQFLLLFISLFISTLIFAQNIGHEISNEKKKLPDNTSLNKVITADEYNILLDEVEIMLNMKHNSTSNFQNINKSIVRNTFSGTGENFCKMFCEFQQSKKVTYPFVVYITERYISNSQHTEIYLSINNNLLYKFRSLNTTGYLNAAVQESIKRLNAYCINTKQFYAGE